MPKCRLGMLVFLAPWEDRCSQPIQHRDGSFIVPVKNIQYLADETFGVCEYNE